MLTINLSQLNTYFLVLMPMIVAFVAGIIRQDKFPHYVNELITVVVMLVLALLQAFFSGKLGGSPLATFGIVAAYTAALLHTPLGQQLQNTIQTNVLSLGKAPPPPEPITLEQIATVVAQQFQNYVQAQAMTTSVRPLGIPELPTQQIPAVVRANTPPAQGG